ncbi:AAA family ATPase [Streptomyces virginiae]|uniref:AAA family ATPase n=1 Tax=Streptomyces virginiae TaxID=1961 RepID=UPI00225BAC7E|nr:AAA family ATPase [Streptomyces virginiae]MCX4721182.1 AAA family ATPase [Streptomyces virginiae]MCX5275694.1 AAA family ATPase [Streptomyces virginiae]
MERGYRLIAVEGVDGSGKSTLVENLREHLSRNFRTEVARPARAMTAAFRELAEKGRPESVLYQDRIPPDFRHSAYLLETAVHFRYRREQFEHADFVLFDRWLQTWQAYCDEVVEHRDWMSRIAATTPEPDVLLWVRIDPETACRRLVERQDRWARIYSPAQLHDKIARLCDRYEKAMLDTRPGAVVLDGTRSPGELLAGALDRVTGKAA